MDEGPALTEEADEEIVQRIARGDQGALSTFYQRHAGTLLAVALRILRDRSAAEDVLQDVFVHLWEKAASFDSGLGKPLGWTVTITRNKAIDRLRARHRAAKAMERVADDADTSSADSASIGDSDRGEYVRGALVDLSTDQRTVIELAFFKGLSQSEIADRLQKPLGTVKAHIRRGMLRLRDRLQQVL